jgi:mannose-6-phosphate isomerase-like protein (cupin superfamily)
VQLWFLNTLVTFPVPVESSSTGRVSVLESLAPRGDSPPLHVHHDEDEVFHILDGELTLVVGGETVHLGTGATALAPRGVPHTYRVDSEQARWLVVTTAGSFAQFVLAASRPAGSAELPEPTGPPSDEEQLAFAELCGRYGIELVGPPLAA